MTKTQHTPGPWFVTGWNDFSVNTMNAVIDRTGRVGEATIVLMPGGSYLSTKEELQANARLIAAAPELLEQLNLVKRYIEMGAPEGILRDNEIAGITAAIAKATGN